jgi:hypothetical protein
LSTNRVDVCAMLPPVVLITDKIYVKTRRYLEKIRRLVGAERRVILAGISGFPRGLEIQTVRDLVSSVIEGSVDRLAHHLRALSSSDGQAVSIVALNQSALLPAIAVQRLIGAPPRPGIVEACDKSRTRQLLTESGGDLSMEHAVVFPGDSNTRIDGFQAERYVVKPAFGMSSSSVRFCNTWSEARRSAELPEHTKKWVPNDIMKALGFAGARSDVQIIEPYIPGTEFSIDGWIDDTRFHAIVQHKLCMVQSTFIGDGPTVSPPLTSAVLPSKWSPLKHSEEEICAFGRSVLSAIGFARGVFHIEARERPDGRLFLIEINPRAPGGSLWRSAFLRSGYDLEIADAQLQLGQSVPLPTTHLCKHVLHYPFYAATPGRLESWGDLTGPARQTIPELSIDFVASLGDEFRPEDMSEEPYLAFAVVHDETAKGLLDKCEAILALIPPTVQARM